MVINGLVRDRTTADLPDVVREVLDAVELHGSQREKMIDNAYERKRTGLIDQKVIRHLVLDFKFGPHREVYLPDRMD